MKHEFDGWPATVRALAQKYPAHMCGDQDICQSRQMTSMLDKMAKLHAWHPRYAVDDGIDMFWEDLLQVARTALQEKDSVVEAIDTFLDASLKEAESTDHLQ